MAGRGGRNTGSFSKEQLQAMGVDKNTPNVIGAPPPIYPTLISKPLPLEKSSARNYKILWKEAFISYLQDSPYFTVSKEKDKRLQRYSDKCAEIIRSQNDQSQGEFHWQLMPAELRPTWKRKKVKESAAVKKQKTDNIEAKLKVLEEKEIKNEPVEVKEDPDSDQEEEEGNVEDDEMDDDIDYGNNYFDNGEDFNDEDDNLDDGPVY